MLVEGDDLDDPIADAVRSSLDGHIVLGRDLANHGHYPAIDVLKSISRLEPVLSKHKEKLSTQRGVALLSQFQKNKDLVEIGAYKAGTNAELDQAIRLVPKINEFLRQDIDASVPRGQSMQMLERILEATP